MKQLIHMCGCRGKSKLTEWGLSSETWCYLFFQFKKDYLPGMNILLLSFLNAKTDLLQVNSGMPMKVYGK